MSNDSNPVVTPYLRYRGLIFGFVLGVAITAVVMGYLWSADLTRQEELIKELSSQNSAKDGTIETLSAQLSERDKGTKSGQSGDTRPGGQP